MYLICGNTEVLKIPWMVGLEIRIGDRLNKLEKPERQYGREDSDVSHILIVKIIEEKRWVKQKGKTTHTIYKTTYYLLQNEK